MHKIGFGGETQSKIPRVPQNKEAPYPNVEPIPVPTSAMPFYLPQNQPPVSPGPNKIYPEKDDQSVDPSYRMPTF